MANVSVYIRGKSLWCSFSHQGKQYRKAFKIKNTKFNLRLANNKALELEDMLDRNVLPTDNDIIIKPFIKSKTESLDKKLLNLQNVMNDFLLQENLSKRSKSMYNATFKYFNKVIDASKLNIKDVNRLHYETFKDYMIENVSYNTARTYTNYMRIFINKQIELGIFKDKNPFIRLKNRIEKHIVTIPDNHFDMIMNKLKETNTELYRLVYVARHTAFRLNELLELKWEHIIWDKNIIKVVTQKDNNRPDLFPLNIDNNILKDFLNSFYRKEDKGKIFNLKYNWVTKPFQKVIEDINSNSNTKDKLPRYTIHEIRKTIISKWAQKLMPTELKTLARHRDINTTMRYYINMQLDKITQKINE